MRKNGFGKLKKQLLNLNILIVEIGNRMNTTEN